MSDNQTPPKSYYRLSKSRHIMKQAYATYKKRKYSLPPETQRELDALFAELDAALLRQDRETSDRLARQLETISEVHLRKTLFDYAMELGIALILALLIATVVRQMWFELYEIPTGSMRPTFKEQDRLTVTKTAFGINIPGITGHFYFDPSLVQRSGVVIWSGDNIDLRDTDTTYFMIFPSKKRYIKRLIGKPGDSLYFYGGQIFGVDKEGQAIRDFENAPWMERLEYIPFLSFDGKTVVPNSESLVFKQMNQPIGRLVRNPRGRLEGEIQVNGQWIKEKPEANLTPHTHLETYADFFGIRNFAMTRLLTPQELKEQGRLYPEGLEEAPLYLELAHNPSLTSPPPLLDPQSLKDNTIINSWRSVIPLQQAHLDALMDNMYTARFVVKNGYAARYSPNEVEFRSGSPRFNDTADGTYEFYYGKGTQIGLGGIAYALPADHPLYARTPSNIQKLYNLGIDLSTAYHPYPTNENFFPHRYAYFRNGDLYLLGAPLLKKDDPALIAFHQREQERAKAASTLAPYVPFVDYGPPLKEGQVDTAFIKTFGVTVPEGHYLVLGDNHAMSADSRVFGFVPEANLEGVPSQIIWPVGERLGPPAQKPYPWITLPRLLIWGVFIAVMAVLYAIHRRKVQRPFIK